MKNYFYLAVLCCIISSCGDNEKDPAIKYHEEIEWSDPDQNGRQNVFIPTSAMRDVKNDDITLYFDVQKEFTETHKDLEILSWDFVFSPSTYAGIYVQVRKNIEFDGQSIFLIDPTNSLVMELKSVKAIPKPKTGGGTFYDFNEVFFRYKLEHGEYVLDIIQIPTTDEPAEKQDDVKDETNKNSIDPRILGPQKKSGSTASLPTRYGKEL